jgi:hypothetical protein
LTDYLSLYNLLNFVLYQYLPLLPQQLEQRLHSHQLVELLKLLAVWLKLLEVTTFSSSFISNDVSDGY